MTIAPTEWLMKVVATSSKVQDCQRITRPILQAVAAGENKEGKE